MNRFLKVTRERKTWKTLLLNFVPFFKCLWHLFSKALWSITTYGTSSLSIHCYTHHKIVIISYFRDYNSKIICITDIRICIWRGCLFFLRLSLILVFDKYIFLPLILSSVLLIWHGEMGTGPRNYEEYWMYQEEVKGWIPSGPRQHFSSQYQYNIKQTSNENKEKCKLEDY